MGALLVADVSRVVVATYIGIGLSGLISLAALMVSILGYKVQAESARAATVSAEAAQRANWLTEQRLMHELGSHSSTLNSGSAEPRSPQVRWSLDRKSKNTYVLRNIGSDTAEEVRIPPESAGAIHRNLPESATLRPNESVEFLMIPAAGFPVPNEVLVQFKGREDTPDVVPVPR